MTKQEQRWIKVSEEELDIRKEMEDFLEKCKNLSHLKKYYEQFSVKVEDMSDIWFEEILNNLRKKYNNKFLAVDYLSYPKTDRRSIPWEIFKELRWAHSEYFQYEELAICEDFLNTPPGKELEGWQKWEDYWKNREDPEDTRVRVDLYQEDYQIDTPSFFKRIKEIEEDKTLSEQELKDRLEDFLMEVHQKAKQYFEKKYGTEFLHIFYGPKLKKENFLWDVYEIFQWALDDPTFSREHLKLFREIFQEGKEVTQRTVKKWRDHWDPP